MTFTLPVTGGVVEKTAFEAAVRELLEGAVSASAIGYPLYADTTAGLAATSDGDGFSTLDSSGLNLYLNDAGAASLQGVVPLSAVTDALAARLDDLEAIGATGAQYTSGGPVACATTADITLSGEQTIDGETTSTDRVLVVAQTDPAENGIYVTAAGAWSRATDMDAAGEVAGTLVYVQAGTANGLKTFVTYSEVTTLDTDDIEWREADDASSFAAALALKAPLASPAFTGDVDMTGADTVTVPTPAADAEAATKLYVDSAISSGAASWLEFSQEIGLTGTPATSTVFSAQTYVFSEVVTRNSTLDQLDLYAVATGTLTIRRFAKSGDDFAQVGSDLDVTISSTGALTLVGGTDYTATEVLEGEYLGFYGPTVVGRVAETGAAFYSGSGDSTGFTDASTQDNINIQLRFTLGARETDLIRDEVDALDTRVTEAEVLTEGTSGVRVIGRDGDMVADTASGANAPCVFAQPVHFKGTVDRINLYAAATGTFYAKLFTKAGNVFTQVGSDTAITVSSTGAKSYVAGTDFTAISVDPGHYLGFFVNGVPAMVSSAGEAIFLGSGTGNASTLTDTQSQSNVQFQVSFRVTPSIVPSTSTGGMVAGKGDVAVDAPGSGVIVGHLGYGQSWMQLNGSDGALTAFEAIKFPMNAITLEDTEGPIGWGGGSRIAATTFWPVHETDGAAQSVMGPSVCRSALNSRKLGRRAVYFGRQEGQGGQKVENLLPSDDPSYVGTSQAYANLIGAVTDAVSISAGIGMLFEVPVVAWCQGAADAGLSVAAYTAIFETLIGHIQTDIMAETGQEYPPQILIVQPPGSDTSGEWPCLQAQVEIAASRSDVTLVCSGWAIPQHDGIHFEAEGCVQVGELVALSAEAVALGQPWSAPYLRDVTRSGTTITAYVGGPHGVMVDETIATDRHYVSGSPVADYGFEWAGTSGSISSVTVEPRKIIIELDTDEAGTLGFAYHGSSRGDGKSVNRGTIRADWKAKSAFLDRDLTLWLASGFWDL
ncbi:hypothetical protein [uncultured Mameliella sp.]|uniref:hypothetical protein n=1 Tax=uncultured Mameliella sp. TaxID=1447087 RepID=UPI00262B0375|nr:hypothetical protein [uncultured Mameliella sp.]